MQKRGKRRGQVGVWGGERSEEEERRSWIIIIERSMLPAAMRALPSMIQRAL